MQSIFLIEWEDKLGKDWMTENSLIEHLKKRVANPIVVHKLYEVKGIGDGPIFRDGFRLVKTWASND